MHLCPLSAVGAPILMDWRIIEMAAFDTTITITDKLTGPLARLRDAGGNLTQPMADIAAAVHDNTLDRFAREVSPDGVPWKASAAALAEGRRTLFKSGDLYRAIQPEHGDDFALIGVIATAGPAQYAQIHQSGGTIRPKAGRAALKTPFGPRKSVTMPARPYLGIESRDLTDIERIVLAHLARAADGKGASA